MLQQLADAVGAPCPPGLSELYLATSTGRGRQRLVEARARPTRRPRAARRAAMLGLLAAGRRPPRRGRRALPHAGEDGTVRVLGKRDEQQLVYLVDDARSARPVARPPLGGEQRDEENDKAATVESVGGGAEGALAFAPASRMLACLERSDARERMSNRQVKQSTGLRWSSLGPLGRMMVVLAAVFAVPTLVVLGLVLFRGGALVVDGLDQPDDHGWVASVTEGPGTGVVMFQVVPDGVLPSGCGRLAMVCPGVASVARTPVFCMETASTARDPMTGQVAMATLEYNGSATLEPALPSSESSLGLGAFQDLRLFVTHAQGSDDGCGLSWESGGVPAPPPPEDDTTDTMDLRIVGWAAEILAVSSEYGGRNGAAEALGAPDVYPRFGDLPGAWAPASRTGASTITLQMGASVPGCGLAIFETNGPGAVVRIEDVSQAEQPEALLSSAMPPEAGQRGRVMIVSFAPRELSAVRIHLDPAAGAAWPGIDAVGLVRCDEAGQAE